MHNNQSRKKPILFYGIRSFYLNDEIILNPANDNIGQFELVLNPANNNESDKH